MVCKILHVFTLPTTAETFFDGQFRYLAEKGQDIWVVSSDGLPEDFATRNQLTYRSLDIQRCIAPFADIKTIRDLISFIRKEQFDAVVGHTPKGAMVAMFAAKLAGVKTRIYYRHGLIYTTAKGLKKLVFKTVERLTANCSTRIVNVSHSLSALAIRDHLNSSKKQNVIGSGTCGGIDTINIFNPDKISDKAVSELRHTLNLPEESFVIGFCGRLCRDKGIIELIEGFKRFQQLHPETNTRLLLVGSYDARDILPQNIKNDIEVNPSIIATGVVPHNILPAYYRLMDVFVLPSYREGFVTTVLEASAMRVPILVSRSHGCIDSIRENTTGRYIDISEQSIALSLADMLDLKLRHSLGNAGRDFVTENFERTKMWPEINEFYNKVLCTMNHN